MDNPASLNARSSQSLRCPGTRARLPHRRRELRFSRVRGSVRDKDALDVLRLLRAVATEDMADRLRGLARSSLPASVTAEALELPPSLFGEPNSKGVLLAVRAAGQAEDPATIAGSLMALIHGLLR